jgi:hypothetical protein
MTRPILIGYQLLIGLSDTLTGALLIFSPDFALRLMSLEAPDDALIYVSFIGAFVFSVGVACLYGAFLTYQGRLGRRLETVWGLTALTRGRVAFFVVAQVALRALPAGWLTVAVTDGACVLIQVIGLRRGWLTNDPL